MKIRYKHIDIAKGLGILLIVLGHSQFMQYKELSNIIFSFHVPLFFLLTGLFFNNSKAIFILIYEKVDYILKPYFITLLLLGIAYIIFKQYTILEFINYMFGVIYGVGDTISWVALWFLPHLFIVYIFSKIILLIFGNSKYLYLVLIFLLIIGFYIGDLFYRVPFYIFNTKITMLGLPFSLDVIFLTSFYFILGYTLRDKIINFRTNYIYLIISISIFISLHYMFDNTIDLNMRRYDSLIVSTLQALTGSYIIIFISYYLQQYFLLTKLLTWIGSGSLFILLFHLPIQSNALKVLNLYFPLYLSTIIAFILASLLPLILLNFVKKSYFLSRIFLPKKSRRLTDE